MDDKKIDAEISLDLQNPVTNDPEYIKQHFSKKFGNAADCLGDKSLDEKYGRKEGRVNWIKLRKIIKNEISSSLTADWCDVWKDEKLSEKFRLLYNLQENNKRTQCAWRAKTGDIGRQSRLLDKKLLCAQKKMFLAIAVEKEESVNKLKEEVQAKWNLIRQMEKDLHVSRKENIFLGQEINSQLENYNNMNYDQSDS